MAQLFSAMRRFRHLRLQTRSCSLWRWGATEGGLLAQLEAPEISTEPTEVENGSDVSSAACGANHSAFVSKGRLFTYGSNKSSQLGRPNNPEVPAKLELEQVKQAT